MTNYDLCVLTTDADIQPRFAVEVSNRFEALTDTNDEDVQTRVFLGWVFLGGCTQKNPPFFWVRTRVSELCAATIAKRPRLQTQTHGLIQ